MMKTRPRFNVIVVCLQAALAQLTMSAARADSGVGVDTTVSNALNSFPYRAPMAKDPDGLGLTPAPRSPTGFLNAQPAPLVPVSRFDDDWVYSFAVEAGVLFGDGNTRNAYFRMFKDFDNGFLLNSFRVEAEKRKSAFFVEADAGGVGRRDQFYGVQFGRYNAWRVRGFYNETVHVFTDTFKGFWNGVGTGQLTLPATNPPAAGAACANPPACTTFTSPVYGLAAPTAQAAVNVAVARSLDQVVKAADNTELSLVRKKGGLRADLMLSDELKVYASGTSEKRKGARPFGATWAAGGGAGNIETVEPIDYDTHDIVVGAEYSDGRNSLNAAITGSFFRNGIDTLSFQNPYLPATALGNNGALFTGGRYDLYPNNDFYNVKAEYARLLPDFYNGRLTATVSASKLRQNDNLIASTPFAGLNGGIAGGNWDSTASLSRQTSAARIDTKLVDLGLTLNPVKALDVRGKLRFYETSNSTDYTACNPLTGQFGRFVNDGSGSALVNFTTNTGTALNAAQLAAVNAFMATNPCNREALRAYVAGNGLAPNSGNLQLHNVPYEYRQLNYNLTADYRLNRDNSITAFAEREEFHREYRERDRTWEDKGKLTYVNRSLSGGTLRVSGEIDRRRGSAYVQDPAGEEFYSAAFGIPTAPGSTASMTNWIHNIEQFRKFDLADRNQTILNGRFNYALTDVLDAAVTAQFRDAKFPESQFGRNGHQRQNSLNLDLNWQPTTTANVYGYYGYQQAHTQQTGDWPNACVLGSTYYFYSNGQVLARAPNAAVPTTPAGTSLVATQAVTPDNFYGVCAVSSDTSPLFPTSRAWNVRQNDRNHVFGLGTNIDFGKPKLSVDYSYTRGRTSVDYDYNGVALGMTPAQIAAAGSGWPDMVYMQHVLTTNLLVPVSKLVSLRLLWSYEWGKVTDWHDDGVSANPTGGAGTGYNLNMLYLDTGPQNWRAHVFGVMLRVQL
jgi:hypothetical protein